MVSQGWIKKLQEETKKWVTQGIIDDGQKDRIHGLYAGQVEYSRLINTIVTLGSVLIGLGILLFVASNWDKMDRPAKIAIVFSVVAFFDIAGYYFRCVKNRFPGLGEGFLLIGAFAFGAGVWLIAQMFQIHYNFSAGIIFWILGILPLVFLFRSWTILSLSSILSVIWLISYNIYYGQREAYGFLALLAAIASFSYIQKQRFPLFVMLVGLTIWLWHSWFLSFGKFELFRGGFIRPQLLLSGIYIIFGFILYGMAMWHRASSRFTVFSFLYKALGVLFITLSAYSLTFAHHYYKWDVSIGVPPATLWPLITLLAVCAAVFSRIIKMKGQADPKELRFMFYFLALNIVALTASLGWPKVTSLSFNLLLLAETLVFMYLGFISHSEGIFRLAIIVFFLDVLSRYFDMLWKMMPRSLLFIFGGVILIAGAVFANRKRIEIEEKMREQPS